MQATIRKKNVEPQIAPQVKDLLTKFDAMIELGFSRNEIMQNLLKDELFVIAMFYREKMIFTEGVLSPLENKDLIFESVEVEYV